MPDYCVQCIHLDWKNKEKYSSVDKFYCDERRKYVEPRDRTCSYYIEDQSKKNKKPDCFITTIVCNILGYGDDCELLNILRNFRETYLKVNTEYIPLLLEYDKVGPFICDYILLERDKEKHCLELLSNFLIPCVSLIKEENYESAIEVYKNMVNTLKRRYGLPTFEISIPASYDLETLGKGRRLQLNTSEI